MKKIERAIVSVFDKNNIIEFVRSLTKFGIEILSTGGTGRLLEKNNIKFEKISHYTGTPEMFDGRVKTLHPKIEGGILFRRELKKDSDDALKYNIPPIDMVICNLYQFSDLSHHQSFMVLISESVTCFARIEDLPVFLSW